MGESESGEGGRFHHNILLLLVYLYIFNTTTGTLVSNILTLLALRGRDDDADLLVLALRHGGFHLRREDPSALTHVISIVIAELGEEGAVNPRRQLLKETALDLKNNRKRADVESLLEKGLKLRKWVNGMAAKTSGLQGGVDRRLRVSWPDILAIPTRGRWWLVGASWVGLAAAGGSSAAQEAVRLGTDRGGGTKGPCSQPTVTTMIAANAGGATGGGSTEMMGSVFYLPPSHGGGGLHAHHSHAPPIPQFSDATKQASLLELAKAMRMNTPTRKSVFCALMGSEDAEAAVEGVLRLGLKGSSERDIVRVLLDCGAQEAAYNSFYGVVGARLCTLYPRFRFTFQLAFWDVFKSFTEGEGGGGEEEVSRSVSRGAGTATPRRVYILARLMASLLLKGCLSMAALKPLTFTSRNSLERLFIKSLLTSVILEASAAKDVGAVFSRLGGAGPDRSILRDGLALFLSAYVTLGGLLKAKKALGGGLSNEEVATRLKNAKKALEKAEMCEFSSDTP